MKKTNNETTIAGWIFLCIVLLSIILELAFSIIFSIIDMDTPWWVGSLLAEGTLVIPVVIYLLIKNENWIHALGLNKIKIGTIFYSILLAIVISPISSLFNLLSQFFVDNKVSSMSDELFASSSLLLIFMTSIVAPLCEEFVLRGFFFNKYNKYCSTIAAALLNGLLFGLVHMNFNQFCYAFVLGLIFCITNIVTGSLFPSIIMHATVNFSNTALLLISNFLLSLTKQDVSTQTTKLNKMMLAEYSLIMFFLAIAASTIAYLILKAMAKLEGNEFSLKTLLQRKTDERIISLPLILGILLAIGYIILIELFS